MTPRMNKEKTKLPTVEECITYLESMGWNIVFRKHFSYAFEKPGAPLHLTPLWFTLGELRDAYINGF